MWFNNTWGNIGMEQNAEIRKIFSGFDGSPPKVLNYVGKFYFILFFLTMLENFRSLFSLEIE